VQAHARLGVRHSGEQEGLMSIRDLASKTTPQGSVTAVWYDEQEKNFVVQHEFVHLSFYEPEFMAFVETLVAAKTKFEQGG
jgi:hypothetical protein